MVEVFQILGYATNWLWKKCTLRETAQPPFISLEGLKNTVHQEGPAMSWR